MFFVEYAQFNFSIKRKVLNFQGAIICVVLVNSLLKSIIIQNNKAIIKTGTEMKLDLVTQIFMQNTFTITRYRDTFDVTIRVFDGAEIWQLVGIFMLSLLCKKYSSNNIGLYRHNGFCF